MSTTPSKLISIDWLQHKGIPAGLYKINDQGQVWSTESEQFLSLTYRKDGYVETDLKFEGHRYKAKVHQLVCRAFHGLPPLDKNKRFYEPDHIDMNRQNNNASNLEWVSHQENMHRRNDSNSDPGGREKKPTALYDLDKRTIRIFTSHKEAIDTLNISPATFYERLTNPTNINDKVLLKIENPEAINGNRIEKRQGDSQWQPPDGSERKQNGHESPKREISALSAKILSKWTNKGKRP